MKIQNTTKWPTHFLRRMTSWCCKELEIGARKIKRIKFRNRADGWTSGHCHPTSGVICISGGSQVDELVRVTAHEVAHRMLYLIGSRSRVSRRYYGRVESGGSEAHTTWHEKKVLEAFLANKESLMAQWMAAPQRPTKPATTILDKRSAKAAAALARWERKFKLARTMLAKCKRRVAYYSRKQLV